MRNTRATVFRTFLEVALECSVKDGADVRKHHPVHWKDLALHCDGVVCLHRQSVIGFWLPLKHI